MKVARLNDWGKPLEIEEVPQPEPKEDEILVRVHAASVNPFDTAIQLGYLQNMSSVPMTMGTDYSGEVVAVGANIKHFKPGDAVFGLSPLGPGSFAEYIIAKPHEVSKKPDSLDHVQAAAVPLSGTAAWKSLFDLLQMKSGERLLVHGAAGNVGSTAVQLAKAAGVYVYGTDIPQKEGHIESLGLDEFILSTEKFEDVVKDLDAVLDLVGGELMGRSYAVLHPGGRYVTSLLGETPQEEPQRLGIRSMGLAAWADANILAQLAERIDSGKLKIFVNSTFPLEEVNAAMAQRLQTTDPGKVIVKIM